MMCILDKEICDVGTSLPFFFFALRVLAFFVCLVGEKLRGGQMSFGAVQSNSIVAFGLIFFPLLLYGDDAEMVQLCDLNCCAVCSWSLLMVDLDVRG